MLTAVNNDDLRLDLIKTYRTEDHYLQQAEQLGLSVVAASRIDWYNASWAWLHWGQYAGIKSDRDLEELAHLVDAFYRIPGMRRSWDTSPWIKPVMDPQFVAFADDILENGVRNDRSATTS